MPTTARRLTTAAAATALACAPLALTTPAHATPTHAAITYTTCQFSDGAAAEIDAAWFDNGQAVYEQIYRTASGGGDLEVTINRKGTARGPGGLPVTWYVSASGPLAVQITDNLGAQCYRVLR